MSEREYFWEKLRAFQDQHAVVEKIYKAISDQPVEDRRAWANAWFFRLWMFGNSLRLLCEHEKFKESQMRTDVSLLDPSSIATVGRSLIEAHLTFAYISDLRTSQQDWLLRKAVLELCDSSDRYRVSKFTGSGEAKYWREKWEKLRKTAETEPIIQALDKKHREKTAKWGYSLHRWTSECSPRSRVRCQVFQSDVCRTLRPCPWLTLELLSRG
jgi:hypothetical protein